MDDETLVVIAGLRRELAAQTDSLSAPARIDAIDQLVRVYRLHSRSRSTAIELAPGVFLNPGRREKP